MKNGVFQVLKWLALVIAMISCLIALFLLCGIPRRYSVPELLPDGSINPLYSVNSLIENLQVTMINEDRANVALTVAVLMLGCHIFMIYIETLASHRRQKTGTPPPFPH